jgi:glucokinase
MPATKVPLSLLADIGGTNTRVAVATGRVVDHGSIRRYANAEFPNLNAVLKRYMADENLSGVEGACVAAAGPVRHGVAEMTNLSWTITGDSIAEATGARRVAILNDLQAQGHALGHIAPDMLREVRAGTADPREGASQLVVGVGTGFNAAPVHEGPGGRIVAASECGHVTLPIRTDADLRLFHFVERVHGFPGVEDVLSGRGLERVHAWVSAEAGQPRERKAADIMASMKAGTDALATETGRVFVRMLGSVTGNLALTHLPFGGIYLIGGVARAFAPYLIPFGFDAAFCDKGRFAGFMEMFPVHLLEDDYAALTGCAAYLAGLGD